jgi:hypothetical protein
MMGALKTRKIQESTMLTPQEVTCLRACSECAAACLQCVSDCASRGQAETLGRCMELARECADLCREAITSIALGSVHMDTVCAQCAQACLRCAAECAKHGLDYCQQCTQSCLRCAATCQAMARQAGVKPGYSLAASMTA